MKQRIYYLLVKVNHILHVNQIERQLTAMEHLTAKNFSQTESQHRYHDQLVLVAATASFVLARNAKVFDPQAPLKWTKWREGLFTLLPKGI